MAACFCRALSFSAGRLLVHIKDGGIVLDLAQALVGCVSQTAVMGPAPKLDLGDQCRLHEYQVLALERHGWLFGLQLVER